MPKFPYAKFREMLEEKQERLQGLKVRDCGLSCYLGENLSPGCLACKKGMWLCVYVTERCNLSCSFCPQPRLYPPFSSNRPETPEEVFRLGSDICKNVHSFEFALNLQKDKIDGISFSGGEPFLVFNKTLRLIQASRKIRPEAYMWVYTNGKLVTERAVKKFREEGVSEIRFNWAASGFDSRVLEAMRLAGHYMDKVVVEVPIYHPEMPEELMPRLESLVEAGVAGLNFAELNVNHNNASSLKIPEEELYRHPNAVSPYWSRLLTYDLMEYVEKHKLPLTVNDCSNDAKSVQKLTLAANAVKI